MTQFRITVKALDGDPDNESAPCELTVEASSPMEALLIADEIGMFGYEQP